MAWGASAAAAVTVLIVLPVAAAWLLVASLSAHAVIHSGEPTVRWRLIRADPRTSLGAAAGIPAGFGVAPSGRVSERNLDALSRLVVVTTGRASLPPKPAVVAVVALPPVRPLSRPRAAPRLPMREQPSAEIARSSPGDGNVRLASAVPPARRDERRAALDILKALTQRVRPALADPRRDDIVGSISAYNNPDLPRFSVNRTAVYDIAAHTVYLPDGRRLEAHSGLGGNFDDPRSVSVKNRGVTPPNIYELALRERPFHGVAALRLNPVDARKMFGRDGILAHSYMLGSRGESNGCVSFKDYAAFLHAYRRGDISRLVVVPRLTGSPASMVARLAASGRFASNGKEAGTQSR